MKVDTTQYLYKLIFILYTISITQINNVSKLDGYEDIASLLSHLSLYSAILYEREITKGYPTGIM